MVFEEQIEKMDESFLEEEKSFLSSNLESDFVQGKDNLQQNKGSFSDTTGNIGKWKVEDKEYKTYKTNCKILEELDKNWSSGFFCNKRKNDELSEKLKEQIVTDNNCSVVRRYYKICGGISGDNSAEKFLGKISDMCMKAYKIRQSHSRNSSQYNSVYKNARRLIVLLTEDGGLSEKSNRQKIRKVIERWVYSASAYEGKHRKKNEKTDSIDASGSLLNELYEVCSGTEVEEHFNKFDKLDGGKFADSKSYDYARNLGCYLFLNATKRTDGKGKSVIETMLQNRQEIEEVRHAQLYTEGKTTKENYESSISQFVEKDGQDYGNVFHPEKGVFSNSDDLQLFFALVIPLMTVGLESTNIPKRTCDDIERLVKDSVQPNGGCNKFDGEHFRKIMKDKLEVHLSSKNTGKVESICYSGREITELFKEGELAYIGAQAEGGSEGTLFRVVK